MSKKVKWFIVLLAVAALLCAGAAADGIILESSHPYEDDTDQTWTYSHPDPADYLKVTFSNDTVTEEGCDFIYIIDEAGNETEYSGTELAGREIFLQGQSFAIRLETDSSVTENGFAITKVTAVSESEYIEYLSTPIASGTFGENNEWVLYRNGLLDISGTGAVDNEYPWSAYADSIRAIQIAEGFTSIGADAFNGCRKLTAVTIPDSVTAIGASAFSSCGLISIQIPAGVTSIGQDAFNSCYSLESIQVDSANPQYSSADGVLFNKNKTELITYPGGKTGAYSIPAGVTGIGIHAFNGCSNLTGVTIPEGVTSISEAAFAYCYGLTKISIPAGVASIEEGVFFCCEDLKSVEIPDSVTRIERSAFEMCSSLKRVYYAGSSDQWNEIEIAASNECLTNAQIYYNANMQVILESEHPYANNTDQTWSYTHPTEASYLKVTFSDDTETEEGYDFIYVTDGTGTTATYDGSMLADHAIYLQGRNFTIRLTSDGSVTYYGFAIIGVTAVSESEYNEYLSAPLGTGTCGENLAWELSRDGVLTITGTGDMNNFGWSNVPWGSYRSTIKTVQLDNGITSIGDYAFRDCRKLSGITLPDSITTIGHQAFQESGLTSVTIPASVSSIGNYVFNYCHNLTNISVSSGNANYSSANGALFNKNKTVLVSFPAGKSGTYTIPDTVTSIGDSAFASCNLTGVTIPGSVTSIGNSAFTNSSLESITIPAGVTSIGNYAFSYCYNLTGINVNSNNKNYSSSNGVLFNKNKTALITYPTNKTGAYTIPDSVTTICESAFADCYALSGITIPDSVTRIEESAFSYCEGLTSVSIPGNITSIPSRTFAYCRNLACILIPDSLTAIGNYAFEECDGLRDVYYGGDSAQWNLISIGYENDCLTNAEFHFNAAATEDVVIADGNCGDDVRWELTLSGALTISGTGKMYDYDWDGAPWSRYSNSIVSVRIESGVTSIGRYAFRGHANLTDVSIAASVTGIGEYAFNNCTSLTGITIPNGVTSIGRYAFSYSSLASVSIPASVTDIGIGSFMCSTLQSISVNSSNANYSSASGVLFNKNKTTLVAYPEGKAGTYTIPSSVTTIGSCAFCRCEGLSGVTIPNGVKNIESSAFSNCTKLTSVTIPASVTKIQEWAFSYCTSLTNFSVNSGNNNYSSANGVLFNKTKTELISFPAKKTGSYTVPATVTKICSGAFAGNSGLTGVTIPNSVTQIGEWVFENCTGLKNVTIPNNLSSISYGLFSFCQSLESITIPISVTDIYGYAFQRCGSLKDVYYSGDSNLWAAINIEEGNSWLTNAEIHFESNAQEILDGGTFGDGLSWTLLNNGTLTISGNGAIPDCDWGEAPWYSNRNAIRTVEIESGITGIGQCAFADCQMISVSIPDSVTRIGGQAFSSCSSLTSITLPAGISEIGIMPFTECSSLTAIQVDSGNPYYFSEGGVLFNSDQTTLVVYPAGKEGTYTIPDSVTVIGEFSFAGCSGITGVTIPEGVVRIGYGAFGFSSLTQVSIPASVTNIDTDAFTDCNYLSEICVDSENEKYSSEDGVLFDKYKSKLIACPAQKAGEYTIPNNVERILDYAFGGCSGLTGITIPGSVNYIGYCAFAQCKSLTDVYYYGNSEMWTNIFIDEGNGYLTGAALHYITAGVCGDELTWVLRDDGTLIISGAGAMDDFESEEPASWYNYRDSIKKVIIEAGVTSIGEYAFFDYDKITEVTMADSVTQIGDHAFRYCSALTDIRLSGSLIHIGYGAFERCSALSSVTLPGSLEMIGTEAFAECNLSSINVSAGVETETQHFFWPLNDGTPCVYHLTLPAGVQVGESAFAYNRLPHETPDFFLPSGLTEIESEAFSGIAARFVWIPDGVTTIGSSTFAGCSNLEYIYIPYGCESIGTDAIPEGTTILIVRAYDSPECAAEKLGNTVLKYEDPLSGNG